MSLDHDHGQISEQLYTEEQRKRRDESGWTLVQGLLAPIQFAVFLTSLFLIMRYLLTGEGLYAANVSIVVKTLTLYTIMITGSIWEKEVFGVYLFAKPFFWEDVFSMLVLCLHTAYLVMLWQWQLQPPGADVYRLGSLCRVFGKCGTVFMEIADGAARYENAQG